MDIIRTLIIAGASLAGFFFLLAVVKSRYKIAGPNQVLVVYGRKSAKSKPPGQEDNNIISRARIITGGGTFVWPGWEQYRYMSLELMTLDIAPGEVNSRQGIPVKVRAVAQVKVGGSDRAMHQAVQGFLSYNQNEMEDSLRETLAGHLRGIVGTQTIEELNFERSNFQQSVRDQADPDLNAMGFEIKSIVIQEIADTRGYMDAIGTPEIARAERDARIAKAAAAKSAKIAEEDSRYAAQQRNLQVDTDLLEESKALQLREAQVKKEVSVAQAQAQKAGELTLTTESIKIAEQETERRRLQLVAEVNEQADADLYAARQTAEADAIARERAAVASAEARRTTASAEAFERVTVAEAEATAVSTQGDADASAIAAVGAAEAGAAEARLLAQAEGRRKMADALNAYTDDAIRIGLLETLPDIVAAAAAPLARAGETTIISSGGKDGDGTGVVQMSEDVWAAVTLIEQKMGINISDIVAPFASNADVPLRPTIDIPAESAE